MSDKVTTQSQYELFQEWLNDCPVQIESYEDNVDSVYVRFDIEVEEEKVIITPQQLEGDISTVTDSDYADKVDTLVDNMVASNDNVFTHDSEGC
jgi:predicted transcriptional regulator